ELAEAVTQMGHRFRRQSPASGGMQRRLAVLIGIGRLVLRRPFTPMPDQLPQSSSGAALLQGPLRGRCHARILRTIAAQSEGFPRAIPLPDRLVLEIHHLAYTAKRSGWVPRTTRLM